MPLILPNTIANEQDADGDKLQQNYATIQDWGNQEVVTRDGATAMTGSLLLPGPPTTTNQAATKGYVDGLAITRGLTRTTPSGQLLPAGATTSLTFATISGSDPDVFANSNTGFRIPVGLPGVYAFSVIVTLTGTGLDAPGTLSLNIGGISWYLPPMQAAVLSHTVTIPVIAGVVILARLYNGGNAINVSSGTFYCWRVSA